MREWMHCPIIRHAVEGCIFLVTLCREHVVCPAGCSLRYQRCAPEGACHPPPHDWPHRVDAKSVDQQHLQILITML